jgi:serine/threonine-protein kinase
VLGALDAATDPLIGRIIHDRYRIQSLVSVGEHGRFYRAEQPALARTVAIEVLALDPARQARDRQLLERFMLGASRASRLTSPTTIAIVDYGRTDDGLHFVVTEDVDGITLARCLEREGRLSILPALTIVGQLCLSLREAHALGLVHGSIEPGRIVLVDGQHDQIKVLGFGVASALATDADDDSRADIHAVGAVLYRSLTGRDPIGDKAATRTLLESTRDPVPAIDPRIGVPRAIEEVVMACLDGDRERRPRSIEDVLYALQVGVLELRRAPQLDPAPAAHLHAPAEPADDGAFAAVESSAVASPPARVWSARAVVMALVAAAALFAVGAAVSLIVRLVLSERDAEQGVGGPARPAARAEEVAPAARSTAPAPPASTASASAVEPDTEASPASEEEHEEGRRRQRGAVRRRTSRDGRAPAAAPSSPGRKRDPVPQGYKKSPY